MLHLDTGNTGFMLLCASLVRPPKLMVFAEFDGHSDMRPRPGVPTMSSRRSGLSQISVSS